MGQHLIFRPPGLYIDHLLEGVGGGSGVWIGAEGEGRWFEEGGGRVFGGIWAFERCAVSGDTH